MQSTNKNKKSLNILLICLFSTVLIALTSLFLVNFNSIESNAQDSNSGTGQENRPVILDLLDFGDLQDGSYYSNIGDAWVDSNTNEWLGTRRSLF